MPISQFALQVNKNPFGIAPTGALVCPDVNPGSSVDTKLPMQPGTLLSNTPPTNPLFLQIAIKNSLDIFYFNVPFDLPAVLLENSSVGKDAFTSVWQRVGEGRQHVIAGNMPSAMNSYDIRKKLEADNITYVAQRRVDDDTTCVYVSGTTTNNCVLLTELTINRNSMQLRLNTRTETPSLVPLFEAALCN